MRTDLTPKTVGRLAAYLFMASGTLTAATLPLPQPMEFNRWAVFVISGIAVIVGGLAYLAPWDRWPRSASLALLPPAFAIIAIGNYYGASRPYLYSVFFIVAFVWIGISHARWTALKWAPLAAIAYVAPILLQPAANRSDASGAALVIPVCVLVAETLAWSVTGERRSRDRAHTLVRVATAVGRHLNERELSQTLVDEAQKALNSEHAVLYQLDTETKTIADVYAAGVNEETLRGLQAQRGRSYENLPRIDTLAADQPIVVEDVDASPADEDLKRFQVRSYLAMPVMARGELVGILWCSESSKTRKYTRGEVFVANALAGQASAAFQNARLYQQTLEASRTDPLTGLENRRAFHERLDSEVQRARRYGRALSLVILDADGFKAVNDAWGHLAGDRVLTRLAKLLESNRRTEDGAYRIGGDEFALILPETPPPGAAVLAERLRRRVERERISGDEDYAVSVSVGVSSFPDHGIHVDELFERADTSLYEVKSSGGNAVVLASPRELTGPGVKFGIDVSAVIEQALLVPVYQPIFELATGTVIGFEEFCRLDPRLGHTPTPTLFRAAGALGLLETLDRSCRTVAIAGTGDLPVGSLLFLNMTPASIEHATFDAPLLAAEIAGAGLRVDQVVLELTEHERTPASDRLVENLKACQLEGFKLALDDFGPTGDLDLLARVGFDYVKVDMSFVHGADGADTRRNVLHGLEVLGSEAGAFTIAEGVETLGDLKLVRELGFRAAQGYFLRDPQNSFDASPRPLKLLGATEPAASPTS